MRTPVPGNVAIRRASWIAALPVAADRRFALRPVPARKPKAPKVYDHRSRNVAVGHAAAVLVVHAFGQQRLGVDFTNDPAFRCRLRATVPSRRLWWRKAA
jgi:hypothetical protein